MERHVSVVIATYNMAKFLPLAIQSVLGQTFQNLELHVVDDGSTDGTGELVKDFRSDPRLKWHSQPNRGKWAAANKGIQESQGDYVAFLDADDIWMKDKLEMQLPLFERSGNIGVVYAGFEYIDENGRSLPTPRLLCYSGRITTRLFVENFVGFNTVVARKKCFDAQGMFDESLPMGGDYDLWLRMSTRYEFAYLDEPTIHYRIWPGQMSRNYEKRYEYDLRIKQRFLERNPNLVDRLMVKEAWAHAHVQRGKCRAELEKDRWNALRDYVQALKFLPTYLPAWKSIAKALISASVLFRRKIEA